MPTSQRPVTKNPLDSIVIPAFNEERRLPRALDALLATVDESTEIIVVDDGSTDATRELASRSLRTGRDRVIALGRNHGKGAAVAAGLRAAAGERLAFLDADGATDVEALPRLFAALDDAELAIGSRAVAGALITAHPSRIREYGGRAFNGIVRALTGLPFRDTQCGFKAVRASVTPSLLALIETDGFMFDIELLLAARAIGLTTVEVPVRWTAIDGSKVHPLPVALSGIFHVARANRRITTTTTRPATP